MSNPHTPPEQAFLARHQDSVPDLGHIPSFPRPQAQTGVPSTKNPITGHEVGQLTPTEVNQCEAAIMALNNRWMRKTYDEDSPERVWDQFANDARNTFGDLGFVIDISWSEVKADGMPGTAAVPQITILGRADKHGGTDHDLIAHEVAGGLHDGQTGYIREDGSRHEDPLKKSF